MSGTTYGMTWGTQDEIDWLASMKAKNPKGFRVVARIILGDRRRWDKHIDVSAIKAACARLLEGASA